MNLKAMMCPKCNAQLQFHDDQDFCYCSHCGTQVFKDDKNKKTYNHTYRKIDEAKIRRAEAEERIQLAKIKSESSELLRWFLYFAGIMLIMMLCFLPLLIFEHNDKKLVEEKEALGMITVGISDDNCVKKNYEIIKSQLEAKGFTNIQLIDLDDAGIFTKKEDTIDSISIGGDTDFSSSDYYFPDAKIIISYH